MNFPSTVSTMYYRRQSYAAYRRVAASPSAYISALGLLCLLFSSANTYAQTIGATLVTRPIVDGARGQVYIFTGDTFAAGSVFSTFSFNAGATGFVTPLLLERTLSGPNAGDDQYIIRGIGTGRTISSTGSQTVAFGLQAGTNISSTSNYTFGFTHGILDAAGGTTADSTGVISFAQPVAVGAGVSGAGTNAFRFANNGDYFGTLAVGTVLGAGGVPLNDRTNGSQGFLIDRTYSAQANAVVAAPEPGSIGLVLVGGVGLLGTVLCRRTTNR